MWRLQENVKSVENLFEMSEKKGGNLAEIIGKFKSDVREYFQFT